MDHSSKVKVKLGGRFKFKCYGPNGEWYKAINSKFVESEELWRDEANNLVVDEGLQHILDILFVSATTQVDPWYIGLTDGTPTPAAGDTLASHAGWVEVADYTGDRKEFVDVRSLQTVTNSASKATFVFTANALVIGGGFLCSVLSGTTGTLLCAAPFDGGDKNVDTDDSLEVQYDFGAADDGV